jgi:hypothetical protein
MGKAGPTRSILGSIVNSRATGGGKSSAYAHFSRFIRAGPFPFIDSAFSHIEDEERRGVLRLQQAFDQASHTLLNIEANRKREHEAADLYVKRRPLAGRRAALRSEILDSHCPGPKTAC